VAALLLFLLAAPIHVAHAGNAPLGGGSCSYGTEPDGTNTMVGVAATPLTGGDNTAIGDSALTRIYGGGQYNTALGYEALASDTTGNNNVAVGMQALQANSTTAGTRRSDSRRSIPAPTRPIRQSVPARSRTLQPAATTRRSATRRCRASQLRR